MTTIAALVRDAVTRLAACGVPSPDVDAIELAAHLWGWEPAEVRTAAARGDELPPDTDLDLWETRLTRRCDREPLQHITGRAGFCGFDLQVGPGVFIPRPETETVVQQAVAAAQQAKRGRDGMVRVIDLCAGSGAIGIALARQVPDASVAMVEASDEAMVYLRLNVRDQVPQVRERLRPVLGDARNCMRQFSGCADVVVSNPPYIPPGAIPRDPEVALHDPAPALYGLGEDGLTIPRAVIDEARRLVRVGGTLIMEHGDDQGAALRAYVQGSVWWTDVHTVQDLTGRDRMLVARRVGV